ncbi:hypothetical protein M911_14190 [Ectothiorhodospira haloalkaliphila]|uniref:Porin n=1 Tax=Ectothiorhodospira haloalkaliphila TaxID=421628 RepID=W8KK14_9GAMM|nr:MULTISPECIES: DcaP family trimeric outer membrane transporter [Ectothiorhodospira]AHK80104.1 hypothetical protein M911_14190 [Ectothiorhodospira haloalkaliphila]MCG5495492.1 porin [Ectothiorhodospira variabilis]MCG5498917.1 porin [Ectothiorhodospira variabilis]MCG5503899.1 porin [Ectothiorhodospira variabilis]MCG5506970.1 porin [Ectothiorhodospira variabilis]
MKHPNKPCTTRPTRLMACIAAGLLAGGSTVAWSQTEIDFGGYVKMDAMFTDRTNDAADDASETFLVPALIPLDGQEDTRNVTRYSVRESRFYLRTRTPTDGDDLITHIELDFMDSRELNRNRLVGNQAPRLRHAFVSLGPWTAGQTWGTFYNVTTKPETLDFVGPVGTLFNRNIQIRYTRPMGESDNLMLSLEQPFTTLTVEDSGTNVRSGRDDRWPDIVARYNVHRDWGHGSVAGIVRNLRAERSTSDDIDPDIDDDVWGAALSLTGLVKIGASDDLRFQLNYGNAIGRYLGLNVFPDAFIEADGTLDTLEAYGGYVAYRHWWNQNTRSNAVVSYAAADNPGDAYAGVNQEVQSVHLNLLHDVMDNVMVGLEYIWAERSIEGRINGQGSGDINRVQGSVRVSF